MFTLNRKTGIFFSALIVAVSGIIHELIIGTVSSYLLGNSVLQFSLTIGLFLFGMGIGSFIVPLFKDTPEEKFILIEGALALIGGNAAAILFATFAYTPYIYPVFTVLVTVIGALIGLEIPFMLKMLEYKKDTITLVSRILSLDYLGSLIASILFPLLMLPYLGLLRSSYLVGLLNIVIALVLFVSFYEYIRLNKKAVFAFLFSCFLILFGSFIFASKISWALDHKLFQDDIVYSTQTQYQKIVVTKFQDDIRLFIDGNIQFSSIDEYRYHEPLVHIPMSAVSHHSKVLVLGGGDGLAVRELLKYSDIEQIDLVDLDKKMTEISSTLPYLIEINENSLQNEKVKITAEDAMKFLEKNTQLYNVIIIDLPDPNNEGLSKLYSKEFYRLVKKHLSDGGIFVTQATSPYYSNEAFWMIKRTVESEDLVTFPYHSYVPSFGDWGFVMGSNNNISLENIKVDVPTEFLTPQVIKTLFIFDKDMLQLNDSTEISTLFNPLILTTYEKESKRWQP